MNQQPLEYLDLSILRQYLRHHECAELVQPKEETDEGTELCGADDPSFPDLPAEGDDSSVEGGGKASAGRKFERLLDDFVLLTFLVRFSAKVFTCIVSVCAYKICMHY